MADNYHFGEEKAENRKRRVVGDVLQLRSTVTQTECLKVKQDMKSLRTEVYRTADNQQWYHQLYGWLCESECYEG